MDKERELERRRKEKGERREKMRREEGNMEEIWRKGRVHVQVRNQPPTQLPFRPLFEIRKGSIESKENKKGKKIISWRNDLLYLASLLFIRMVQQLFIHLLFPFLSSIYRSRLQHPTLGISCRSRFEQGA